MLSTGDDAPDVTPPMHEPDGNITEFTLSDALEAGPVVLAFFAGAFTRVCTGEMRTLRDRLDALTAAGASLYAVSIDTPFAPGEFAEQNDLNVPLVGDPEREVVDGFGVSMDVDSLGIADEAKRAVFVVDEDGTITYAWVADDPSRDPTTTRSRTRRPLSRSR